MPDPSFLQRLKERKLVQWALAYLAGAWVLFEAADAVGGRWNLPDVLFQGLFILLAVGFFVALILAWYHGERGRQRVSGPELLMVASLLVVAGVALSLVPGEEEPSSSAEPAWLAPDDDRPSIAVLPFDNLSPDPEDAYFADGMVEEVISKLSAISALRVISRTSVMRYRGPDKPSAPQIAEELGARFLLEGSARIAGDRARLTLQLIQGTRDEHLWTDDFDLSLSAEDLFEVQSEVARRVAFSIGVNLTPEERDQAARVLTESTDCYLTYLRGKEELLRERQIGMFLAEDYESRRLFDQAIELDPEFAPARAHLALTLTYTAPDEGRYERAQREAERALSLMPELGEARVALGRYFQWAGRPQEAMRHFRAAVEEDPNLSLAVVELGGLQWNLGDLETGLQILERAASLDPQNPNVLYLLSSAYRFAHRFDESLEANRRQEKLYRSSTTVHTRAYIHLLKGDLDQARAAIEELISDYPYRPYQQAVGNPRTVVSRVLTEEQRRVAFESYQQFEGPCTDLAGYCLRKAIHEEEVGSKATARIYWDSLALVVDRSPPRNRRELPAVALIYQGLGEKEAAIGVAEALVDLRGASSEGGTPSAPALSEDRIFLARILAHFGESDRAIDILEEELPIPSSLSVPLLEVDPIWDPLRDHPRFQALLETYKGT